MQRAIFFLAVAIGVVTLASGGTAQPAPRVGGLTPLQIQRFSRDLVPSSSQDFFEAGQAKLEQEVQGFTRRRSHPDENLLNVNQNAKMQSNLSPDQSSATFSSYRFQREPRPSTPEN